MSDRPEIDDQDRTVLLLHGLLTTEEQREAYRTNVHFKSTMDMLVQLLPLWVDGIAAQAAETQRDLEERIELMKRSVNLGPIIPSGASFEGWIPGAGHE